MTIDVLPDHGAAATHTATIVGDAIRADPQLVLGLPTGRTPLDVYAALVAARLTWAGVRTFNLDEFVGLSPDHPSSFRRYMDARLFDHVDVPAGAIGFLRGDAEDLGAECARYDAAIDDAGGLELLLLGLGANGHIGFNEPAPMLSASAFVATLHEATRRANAHLFNGEVDAVPTRALTLGMRQIVSAARIVVLATGAAKAAAVEAMVSGSLTTACPASWLQTHRRVRLVVDTAAASRLARTPQSA